MTDRKLIEVVVYSDRVILKYSDLSAESIDSKNIVNNDLSTMSELTIRDNNEDMCTILKAIDRQTNRSVRRLTLYPDTEFMHWSMSHNILNGLKSISVTGNVPYYNGSFVKRDIPNSTCPSHDTIIYPELEELYVKNTYLGIYDRFDSTCLHNLKRVTIIDSDISAEMISQMTNVKHLTIENRNVSSIEWDGLTELESLTIKKCYSLDRMPDGIDRLPKLERLTIADSILSKVDAINTNVRHLDLSNNLMTCVPKCGSMLESLNISQNRLTELDSSISKMTTLKMLDVSSNPIGDVHYSMIPNTVRVLRMRACQLSISEETIRRLHDHVEIMDLRDNSIDYDVSDDRFIYI